MLGSGVICVQSFPDCPILVHESMIVLQANVASRLLALRPRVR